MFYLRQCLRNVFDVVTRCVDSSTSLVTSKPRRKRTRRADLTAEETNDTVR